MIRRIFAALAAVSFLLVVLTPHVISAQVIDPSVCTGVTDSTLCKDHKDTDRSGITNNKIFGPDGIMTKAARIISIILGVAAVIMIIVGGMQYVMSSGDPTNVTNAKNTILYAIIGLVVALMARAIISFVLVRI